MDQLEKVCKARVKINKFEKKLVRLPTKIVILNSIYRAVQKSWKFS